MRPLVISLALALAALFPQTAGAAMTTFGADLSGPVTNTRTCDGGFGGFDSYTSCTWWSIGTIQGSGSTIVPYGGGTVKRVRVKVGPLTGRMQVVALRLMRNQFSMGDPGCCFYGGAGPVFTPAPNAVTELAVNIPVKHETDPRTGTNVYDVLALSVLDPGVPVPAQESSGYTGGGIAGMFPAYAPPEERLTGYGAIGFGNVMLNADLEPAPIGATPAVVTPPATRPPTTSVPPQTGVRPTNRATVPGRTGAAPAPTVVAAVARVRGRAARVKVECSAASRCRGDVVIQSASRRTTLARGRLTIAAGRSKTVVAKLTAAGRRALRRRARVAGYASVRVGGKVVATRRLQLLR